MSKLSKMSMTRLRANKRAVVRLIKHYKGEKRIPWNKSCPLCTVARNPQCDEERCCKCLWEVLREPTSSLWTLTCIDNNACHGDAYDEHTLIKPYAAKQLPRLYGWRKAIDNELGKRAKK